MLIYFFFFCRSQRFFGEPKSFTLWHPCENLLLKPWFLRVYTLEPQGIQILLGMYFVGVFNICQCTWNAWNKKESSILWCILKHVQYEMWRDGETWRGGRDRNTWLIFNERNSLERERMNRQESTQTAGRKEGWVYRKNLLFSVVFLNMTAFSPVV